PPGPTTDQRAVRDAPRRHLLRTQNPTPRLTKDIEAPPRAVAGTDGRRRSWPCGRRGQRVSSGGVTPGKGRDGATPARRPPPTDAAVRLGPWPTGAVGASPGGAVPAVSTTGVARGLRHRA